MIIERRSFSGMDGYGASLSDYTDFFDTLCDWDDREEVTDGVEYSYGGVKIKISKNENSYFVLGVHIGTYTYSLRPIYNNYFFHFLIAKTDSSVGISVFCNSEGATFPAGHSLSNPRFVLTKCVNLDTGAEEKGIVFQDHSTSQVTTRLSSANYVVNTGTTIYLNYGTASTVLYPAASAAYPGYCPHVFIPVFQNCTFTNSKCTVNGSDYYILGGTLYLLDD